MKKLYRRGTVHPSPPIISDQLSFLPATILTLTVALSPEDREVLAYLISCSSNTTTNPNSTFINFSGNQRRSTSHKNGVPKATAGGGGGGGSGGHGGCAGVGDHPPLFNCDCFRCYMSYWVRWDESPNRQLIHEIIDAFEDWLVQSSEGGAHGNGKSNNRKDKKNKRGSNNINSNNRSGELKLSEFIGPRPKDKLGETESVGETSSTSGDGGAAGDGNGNGNCVVEMSEEEKGSVRRFVSFIGERIWGVWNQ